MKRKLFLSGMLVIMLLFSLTVNAQEVPPEEWSVADRWHSWVEPTSKAKISHQVASDGVVTVNVTAAVTDKPIWNHLWKAHPAYKYTAEAGKSYIVKFEAWTQKGTRGLNISFYGNDEKKIYLETAYKNETTTNFSIDNIRRTYIFCNWSNTRKWYY